MDSIEILVPLEKNVKVGDKVYIIKKFSLMQLINLSRFFVKLAGTVKVNFKQGGDNLSDLLEILSNVTEEQAVELFSILMNSKDLDGIRRDIIGVAEVSTEVLLAICEVNDFEKLFGNFQKAGEQLKKMTIKTSSLPS
jgi:hypothetical protein